jgi:hypothetical protein
MALGMGLPLSLGRRLQADQACCCQNTWVSPVVTTKNLRQVQTCGRRFAATTAYSLLTRLF